MRYDADINGHVFLAGFHIAPRSLPVALAAYAYQTATTPFMLADERLARECRAERLLQAFTSAEFDSYIAEQERLCGGLAPSIGRIKNMMRPRVVAGKDHVA